MTNEIKPCLDPDQQGSLTRLIQRSLIFDLPHKKPSSIGVLGLDGCYPYPVKDFAEHVINLSSPETRVDHGIVYFALDSLSQSRREEILREIYDKSLNPRAHLSVVGNANLKTGLTKLLDPIHKAGFSAFVTGRLDGTSVVVISAYKQPIS